MHLLKHTSPKTKGTIIITEEMGKVIEHETHQCVHCGKHWILIPGSGKDRGYCLKCNGLTCGRKECDPCRPYMKQIEEGFVH